ncbi:FAD-binding-3 domain-containing protein [Mycena venus]|uniref:FAD-binding-3 domain-containing protein n=1 Tax=Mycena venus TaxID=2733690 RepID=A0A8H6XIE2_9AGAR|nr:FAD-binding-3 domain-containing protein [Mycena venus]
MASPSVLIVSPSLPFLQAIELLGQAGAGPSGLILALILLKNGVSVRIIDKEIKHRIGSRGSGIQPRTLELYDILGVLPNIQKAGEPVSPISTYEPGEIKPTKTFRLSEYVEPTPDTPHPNALNLSQDIHEEILRAHLQTLSCSVELGSELRAFEQFSDHVVARIVKTDSDGSQHEESTKFDWLIGTDGAHSVVRKQLGLSFLGETREEQHLALGDIVVEEGADPKFWHMWSQPPKLIALRSGGSTSKVFMFAYTGRPEALAHKTITREEFIEEFYAMTGRRDVKFGAATWLSNYRPNMRMVDKMQVGRVFIAGDAAHCHSPTGGQGLNSSVQDVANLGWKLALVHKGLAAPALLDTYSEERLRVIAQMLKLTTELYNKSFDNISAGKNMADAWARRGGNLGMLGINYYGSSIVLEDGAPLAGGASDAYSKGTSGCVQAAYRAPDAPGLVHVGSANDAPTTSLFAIFSVSVHTVLLFGGDESAHARVVEVLGRLPKEVVRAVQLLPRGQTASDSKTSALVLEDHAGHAYAGYGVRVDSLTVVVVRPDGVVGAVVSGAEGLERYFQKDLLVTFLSAICRSVLYSASINYTVCTSVRHSSAVVRVLVRRRS